MSRRCFLPLFAILPSAHAGSSYRHTPPPCQPSPPPPSSSSIIDAIYAAFGKYGSTEYFGCCFATDRRGRSVIIFLFFFFSLDSCFTSLINLLRFTKINLTNISEEHRSLRSVIILDLEDEVEVKNESVGNSIFKIECLNIN